MCVAPIFINCARAQGSGQPQGVQISTPAFDRIAASFPHAQLEHRFSAAIQMAVRALQPLLQYRGKYMRPEKSRAAHPFFQRQFPEIRKDKFEPEVVLSKEDFMEAAVNRPPPLAEADSAASVELAPDLCAAMDFIVEHEGEIIPMREERMARLRVIASVLEPLRNALDALKCETAREVSPRFNVAWTCACVDAMEWPDIELPLKYITGFEVVYDVPDSGVYRADEQPASITPDEFANGNTRMNAQISQEILDSVANADASELERRKQCWIKSKEEIGTGLVRGPFSSGQIDRKYGRGRWRAMGRNAILQKGKWRCIDNAKRSKHNKATTMHERITTGRADFPVTISREIAKRLRKKDSESTSRSPIQKRRSLRMRHGTNDLRAAYRRKPSKQPHYTVVAVYDYDAGDIKYLEVLGLNFGLLSAVVSFNRSPELFTSAARRLAWVLTEHYFDDNDTSEPSFAGDTGQECLVELCSDTFFGFEFDGDKDVMMDDSNEYLGVISDLSETHRGIMRMDVSRKRRGKIKELTVETQASGKLASGLASSIFGKARFMLSPCFGSVGKAALQPIKQREQTPHMSAITTDLEDSLEFISFLADHLPATELPLLPVESKAVVIFTDAEGKKRKGSRPPTGHVGFVVIHPKFGKCHSFAPIPKEMVELFEQLRKKDTYIAQFELVATVVVMLSLPDEWLRGYPVELWVDNAGAIGALIKGYSGKPECARIVNMFHFTVAKSGIASLWIDYVPSESNPADIPSRYHEMSDEEIEDMADVFGPFIPSVVPTFTDGAGNWLSSVEIARQVWG